MTDGTYIKADLFEGGPPMRLERTLGLVEPDEPRVGRRAFFVVLLGWAPLAVLAVVQVFTSTSQTARSFFSDFAVHARFLIATPALILAEADCIPRLGEIARHFVDAGLVSDSDSARYERAVASTRRLLDSAAGDALAAALAYAIVVILMFYVSTAQLPEWHLRGSGGFPDLSAAGWWHALVSLPLLLMFFFGWLWRLILWARFLVLMAMLDLHLIPSHPDHTGGLKFVSSSLRKFRLVSFAMGAVVAGSVANRVVHHGQSPLAFKNFAIGLTIFIIIIFAGPLTVFIKRLRETKKRGVFEYGALAGYLGTQFEIKWLSDAKNLQRATLEVPDFSATTDLYSVAANVYEMRDVPFSLKDLLWTVAAALVPFLPVFLLAVPFQVIIDSLVKLLL